jgi:hypothetical protein
MLKYFTILKQQAHLRTLKLYIPTFALTLCSSVAGDVVIDRKIIFNDIQQRGEPFQLRQIIDLNGNGLVRQKIVSNRSTMKVTPPFGLDENQTFPWASAEKVVLGLLHIKSGGKRNRANSSVPYYSYSLEIDPLVILRGKDQLKMQLRRKGDLRTKVSNTLRKMSREIKDPASLDIGKVQLRLDELLTKEDKKGKKNLAQELKFVRGSYYGTHEKDPEFPDDDQLVLIALTGTSSTKKLAYWEGVNATTLDHVTKLIDLPFGWSLDGDGKPLSPWSEYGKQSQMREENPLVLCSKSDRGYSPADEGLTLSTSKIPSEFIQNNYANRDGDGFFTLSLRNTTDFPLSIPSLRRNKNGILWKESLVCLVTATASSSGTTTNSVCLPSFSSLNDLKSTEATILEPGQEISTTVNPLLFSQFPEIKGYSQLYFRFCLGKMVAQTSFYFNSAYHEKIIRKIKAGVPTRPISLGD